MSNFYGDDMAPSVEAPPTVLLRNIVLIKNAQARFIFWKHTEKENLSESRENHLKSNIKTDQPQYVCNQKYNI